MEDIMAIKDVKELRELPWRDPDGRYFKTDEEICHVFRLCDALWLHSGNPRDPHAELTSGKCSNGFVDVSRTLRFTNLCELLAHKLWVKINEHYTGPVDWVIGSDHAAAIFSHSVATYFQCQHDFTEKGPNKTQLWKRLTIQKDEVVLQVEELMTTAKTLRAVREGIRKGNAFQPVTFAPLAAVLVHRSDVYEIESAPIISLIHLDIKSWEPDKCPLCDKGSKRLRPKSRENWAKLTGKT